jgi:hypothetical protein
MKRATIAAVVVLSCLLLATGCVERTMLIRSEPAEAPVWVDEEYAGRTPLEHPFAHYGSRSIRVGPVRDEKDKARYAEKRDIVRIEAPWYETFPLDFFFEVLYPFRLTDEHELPTFVLEPAVVTQGYTDEEMQDLLREAEQFRQRALTPVPEEELSD